MHSGAWWEITSVQSLARVYLSGLPGYTARAEYEWDPEKDRINRQKHGVPFAEASTVFLDPLHVTVLDDRHSVEEVRFRTIGYTNAHRLIVVAHTDRTERIRIINAREATARERRHYEQ